MKYTDDMVVSELRRILDDNTATPEQRTAELKKLKTEIALDPTCNANSMIRRAIKNVTSHYRIRFGEISDVVLGKFLDK